MQKEPAIRQTNVIPQDTYFSGILYTENHHSKLAKPVIFSIDNKIAPVYCRLKPTTIKELNIKSTNYINKNQSSNKFASSLPVRILWLFGRVGFCCFLEAWVQQRHKIHHGLTDLRAKFMRILWTRKNRTLHFSFYAGVQEKYIICSVQSHPNPIHYPVA